MGHLRAPLVALGGTWDSFGPLFGYLRLTLTLLWRPWVAHWHLWRSILLEFDTFLTFQAPKSIRSIRKTNFLRFGMRFFCSFFFFFFFCCFCCFFCFFYILCFFCFCCFCFASALDSALQREAKPRPFSAFSSVVCPVTSCSSQFLDVVVCSFMFLCLLFYSVSVCLSTCLCSVCLFFCRSSF